MVKNLEVPELEPLVLLEDEPVPSHRFDELQLMPYSQVVAGTAVGTRGPFTIGVFASWGEGKTSVLKQAQSLIDDTEQFSNVVTVWFNAWQFEKEDHPIVPLLATIVREVEKKRMELERSKKIGKAVKESFKKMAHALRAVAYGFSAKAKLTMPGFAEIEAGFVAKEMVERYNKLQTQDDILLDRSLYYNAFETLKGLAGEAREEKQQVGPKIVIFIDDLDRCLPDNGLKLLESIKLVLTQPGFVFVLAVDKRIIEGYLQKRYKDDFGVEDYDTEGTSYLDKIVQLPLHLPSHQSRFERYIEELLKHKALSQDANVGKAFTGLLPVLTVGSNYNPRSLIRFINNLLIDYRIRHLTSGCSPDSEFLQFCAVSRGLQPALTPREYRDLLKDQALCDVIAKHKGEPVRTRLSMEPPAAIKVGWRPFKGNDLDREEEGRLAVLRSLDRHEHLVALLDSEVGQRWLKEREKRQQVDQFLIIERQEVDEVALSQKEIVEEAIRAALSKEREDPITEEDRKLVTKLSLHETEITDAGLTHLTSMTSLRTLNLGTTGITDVGLAQLKIFTLLEELSLDRTQITDAGIAHLKGLSSLEMLNLGATGITDAGVENLKDLSSLVRLYLFGARITDIGLAHIGELNSLAVVALDDTGITDVGLTHLKNLDSLTTLSLTGTRITDKGLAVLKDLKLLGVLYLDKTEITDGGLVHLKELNSLDDLYLDNTVITDAGLDHLRYLTRLSFLSLVGTKVSLGGKEQLKKDLPNCNIT